MTYTIADSAGNDASLARNVTVVDTTSPTITLTGDSIISLEINSDFSDPEPSQQTLLMETLMYPSLMVD